MATSSSNPSIPSILTASTVIGYAPVILPQDAFRKARGQLTAPKSIPWHIWLELRLLLGERADDIVVVGGAAAVHVLDTLKRNITQAIRQERARHAR